MVHLIIMTIEHNSVEYINVPFKYALFRDKSNQAHNSKMKLELNKANKALFFICTLSSIGRASALHAEGYRFETYRVHQEWAINSLKQASQSVKLMSYGLSECDSLIAHQYGGLNPTAWVIGCDPMSASSTLVDHPKKYF